MSLRDSIEEIADQITDAFEEYADGENYPGWSIKMEYVRFAAQIRTALRASELDNGSLISLSDLGKTVSLANRTFGATGALYNVSKDIPATDSPEKSGNT